MSILKGFFNNCWGIFAGELCGGGGGSLVFEGELDIYTEENPIVSSKVASYVYDFDGTPHFNEIIDENDTGSCGYE